MATLPEGVDLFRIGLCVAGAALASTWSGIGERARRWTLAVVTALALASYPACRPTATTDVDAYDLVHYYLNAKYFDELGYLDLYPCAILADLEHGGPWYADQGDLYLAQSETTARHEVRPMAHALARGREVRDTRFTPARWASFEHDFLVLQRETTPTLPPGAWRELVTDHGYNGTPAWTWMGGVLASAVPVEAVKLLAVLDPLLLAGALAFVALTYGGEGALWLVLWLSLAFGTRWPVVGQVFLRYDWVACLLVAMCSARRGRPLLAGALTGVAGALRVFPVLWLWGPLARATRERRSWLVIVGFAAGLAGTSGVATTAVGLDDTAVYVDNMRDQMAPRSLSPRSVGLPIALTWDGGADPPILLAPRRARIGEQATLAAGLAGIYLVAVGAALSRRRDDEAFGYGFLPFFLLASAEYYYGVARVTLALVHASGLAHPRDRFGLAALFALEAASITARSVWPGSLTLLGGTISWGLCAYALVIGAWLLRDDGRS